MNYVKEVQKFVIENFLFGEADKINEETSFLESGIIDSTGVLELVAFLEETCGFTIEDEELIPENLDGLNKIGQFIERKLNGSKNGLCVE